MARTNLEIQPPISGLDRAWSYQSQPPFTLPDALNCRTRDVFEQRTRLGSRPGLVKAFSQNVSTPLESFDLEFAATKDTWLYELSPDIPEEDEFDICVGIRASGRAARMILHFDMSAIPASATIVTASLELFPFNKAGVLNGPAMKVRMLNQTAWVEAEATWNSYSTGNAWSPVNAIGPQTGPYLATPEADWIMPIVLDVPLVISGLGPLAQEAYDTYSKNLHLFLSQNDETALGAIMFFGPRDYVNVSERPKLSVTYEI